MTIIVKKPFEPFEENRVNGTNAGQIHPEFEEKPVVESTTQTSEDTHGGSELTFSLPNSSQSSRQENDNNQADQNNTSAANADSAQEQQNADGGKSNDNNETSEVDEQSNESSVDSRTNNTQEPQSTVNDTNDQSAQEQENEQNSENDGEGKESEGEDADEQAQSGTYNTQQVVDVINAVSADSKYYQTEFWRFIEMISEEKTRTFDPMGSDEYNVRKLLFRQYERKPLSSYKMSRVRESVVIILDNSGSMQWWADNLATLADLAMRRNDVEVYLAPNGYIEERLYPKRQQVNHDDVVKRLRNRKIIYVGDFDGADTPIELSWYNDVIWICPEERYLNFLEHDWVHYDEGEFKGAFLRVFTLDEMFNAFRRLLSNPSLRIWYDLCNETHRCGGDEDA